MKIKELIEKLSGYNQEAEVLLGGDEELNVVYKDIETALYGDDGSVVMWGNSGSEVDE